MDNTNTSYPLITINGARDPSQDGRISRFASLHHGARDGELHDRDPGRERPRTYSQSSYGSNHTDEFDIRPDRNNVDPINSSARSSFLQNPNPAGNHGAYAPVQGLPQLWRPFWLRAFVLGGFIFLFAALLASIVLLQYYANEKDGFSVNGSTSSYAWTYGPTALLVIAISLWRQVDYYCKVLTPWAELRRRPVSATDSLFLDYLSPLQWVSRGRAATRGHVAVVATILGAVVLKIMAIFATGLFVLVPTIIMNPAFPLNTTTKFDSALASPYNVSPSFNADAISNAPVYAYYGHLAHGLPFAPGVTKNFAYATIGGHSKVPANATLIAEVDAFVPSTNCSAVKAQIDGPTSVAQSNQTGTFNNSLSLLLPDGFVCEQWSVVEVQIQDPETDVVPPRQISGTMQPVYCLDKNKQTDLSKGPDAYLFTLTDIRYTQTLFANASLLTDGVDTLANNTSMTVANMTNVLCQPSYTITRMNVTNSTTASAHGGMNVSTVALHPAVNRTLDGFSAWNLTTVFSAVVNASSSLYDTSTIALSTNAQVPSTLFSLLAFQYNSSDYQVLFDPSKLMSAVEATFDGISAQFAHQYLMSPSQDAMTGTAIYLQHRLRMQPASYYALITGFIALIIMTLLVLFLGPGAVVSRDPSSIGSMAAILARSSDLNNELRAHTSGRSVLNEHALQGKNFRVSVEATETGPAVFKIEVEDGPPSGPGITPDRTALTKWRWWYPMSLSVPSIFLIMAVPTGLIVALELLQRRSDQNQGLQNMSDNRYDAVFIHWIPALLMLLVASLFTTLDFNIAIFAPFAALQRGYATARRTLMSHLLGKLPPFALIEAIRCAHIGAVFSLSGALAASALTIVVSGLYSVQVMNFSGPTRTLTRLDTFNTTWNNSYGQDHGAAATLSLIEHRHMSYPDFTYGELAFPQFALGSFSEQPNGVSLMTGPDTATLPALRGNLDCGILPTSSYTVSTQPGGPLSYNFDTAFVNVQFALPADCQLADYLGHDSVAVYTNTFKLNPDGQDTYAGAVLDLLFNNNTYDVNTGETDDSPIPDNPAGCPSLAFTFGQFRLNSTDTTNVTTIVCYQQIQQVSTNTTFIVNSTTIDTRHPPTVDESTAKLVVNPLSTRGQMSYQFRLQQNLADEVAAFTGEGYTNVPGGIDNVTTLDIFYQAVTNGSEKNAPEDLVGVANQLRLINATNHFYRKYMAQAINANMRQPCIDGACAANSHPAFTLSPRDTLVDRQSSSNNLSPLAVTVSTPRLIQDRTSKLVLQILLGIALLCAILALSLTKTRSVLPWNPCSIAGTMALLAGSELCRNSDDLDHRVRFNLAPEPDEAEAEDDNQPIFPPGAEFLPNSAFSQLLIGKRFSMGWWRSRKGKEREGTRGKRFGIDLGRANGRDDEEWELRPQRGLSLRQKREKSRLDRLPEFLKGPLRDEDTPRPEQEERRTETRGSRIDRLPPWLQGPLRPGEESAPGPGAAPGPGPGPGPTPPTAPVLGPGGDAATVQSRPQTTSRLSKLPGWLQGPLRDGFDGNENESGDGDGRGRYGLAPLASPALIGGQPGGGASGPGGGQGGNRGLRIRDLDREGPGA